MEGILQSRVMDLSSYKRLLFIYGTVMVASNLSLGSLVRDACDNVWVKEELAAVVMLNLCAHKNIQPSIPVNKVQCIKSTCMRLCMCMCIYMYVYVCTSQCNFLPRRLLAALAAPQ